MNSTTSTSFMNNVIEWGSNSPTAMTTAAAAAVVLLCTTKFISSTGKNKKNPPSAPVTMMGCVKAFGDPKKLVPSIIQWATTLGFPSAMVVPVLPGTFCIMTCDPFLARDILFDKDTRKPPMIYKSAETIWGANIGTHIDHSLWKPIRKNIAPAFSSKSLDRMNRICSEQVDAWMEEYLDPLSNKGESFDPAELLLMLTVSVIYEVAFDHKASKEEIQRYIEDIELVSTETYLRFFNPLRAWLEPVWPSAKKARGAVNRNRSFGKMLLEKHRSSPNPVRGTVIDLIDKCEHYESDDARIREIDAFVFGGHETTSNTIAWVLYALARNPEEMKKLRTELLATPEAERTSCPALQNVVKESMRLNHVSPFSIARTLGREFRTKEGHVVPKGSVAFLSQAVMNLNPKIYGDDAHEFRPDRWTTADDTMKSAYAPFAVGARDCVAQRLAYAEIYSIVSKLMSRYDLELVADPTPETYITYNPAHGKIKATRI